MFPGSVQFIYTFYPEIEVIKLVGVSGLVADLMATVGEYSAEKPKIFLTLYLNT